MNETIKAADLLSQPNGSVWGAVNAAGQPAFRSGTRIIIRDFSNIATRVWFVKNGDAPQAFNPDAWKAYSFEKLENERVEVRFLVTSFTPPIIVTLNGSHTAVVNEKEVIVGCQHFSFGAIDNLAKAVNAQRAANHTPVTLTAKS